MLIDETQGLAGMLGILPYKSESTEQIHSQKYIGRRQGPGVGGWEVNV